MSFCSLCHRHTHHRTCFSAIRYWQHDKRSRDYNRTSPPFLPHRIISSQALLLCPKLSKQTHPRPSLELNAHPSAFHLSQLNAIYQFHMWIIAASSLCLDSVPCDVGTGLAQPRVIADRFTALTNHGCNLTEPWVNPKWIPNGSWNVLNEPKANPNDNGWSLSKPWLDPEWKILKSTTPKH